MGEEWAAAALIFGDILSKVRAAPQKARCTSVAQSLLLHGGRGWSASGLSGSSLIWC